MVSKNIKRLKEIEYTKNCPKSGQPQRLSIAGLSEIESYAISHDWLEKFREIEISEFSIHNIVEKELKLK